jgi:uncharacterized protein
MTVFLALWNTSDQCHQTAESSFARLLSERASLGSTAYVLLECGNAAARRPYRSAVIRLRDQLERNNRLISPNLEDWQSAWGAYARGDADFAGIVDQISFVVMGRLGLKKAFTNDKHFRAAGFETLF